MISFNYSIQNDTFNGSLNYNALVAEYLKLNRPEELQAIVVNGDVLRFDFTSSVDIPSLDAALDVLVFNHKGAPQPEVKILSLVKAAVKDKDFRDIDYKVELEQPLFPKRTFVKGELREVKWYADEALTNEILKVNITYIRDSVGFAVSRTTTRSWVMTDNSYAAETKVTKKNYTINSVDQIIEGKRRRENIVNGVQLPTLQFMLMTIQGMTQTQILLMGRDFMDRFSLEFKNFIDNSSSITEPLSPNYGKKTVVVALETAATSTDPWLNNTPSLLGGASILQYLSSEFTI